MKQIMGKIAVFHKMQAAMVSRLRKLNFQLNGIKLPKILNICRGGSNVKSQHK